MTHIVKPLRPDDEAASRLIAELDAYQLSLYPAESNHLDGLEELMRPNVLFIGAYTDERLAGIGAVKRLDGYGEIKRVYVQDRARGRGLGRRLMVMLEQHLRDHGVAVARLETGSRQPEAIALYQRLGYSFRGPFGAYAEDPLSVFMEKRLR